MGGTWAGRHDGMTLLPVKCRSRSLPGRNLDDLGVFRALIKLAASVSISGASGSSRAEARPNRAALYLSPVRGAVDVGSLDSPRGENFRDAAMATTIGSSMASPSQPS